MSEKIEKTYYSMEKFTSLQKSDKGIVNKPVTKKPDNINQVFKPAPK